MTYRWTMHRFRDAAGKEATGPRALNLWWLARAAAEETLQGSPLVVSWLKLFRSHLDPNETYWLQWAGDLAESTELRRAYSGLYGRFVARALLTAHCGFSRFISLKRTGVNIPNSINVTRNRNGDIPDWVAWDDRTGKHVLCEAKGSLTANDFLIRDIPSCIQQGKRQFARVTCTSPTGALLNPACWVAASRWATTLRHGRPATILWDPPTDQHVFSDEDKRNHRLAMTRTWLGSIATGLGWKNADDLISSKIRSNSISILAKPGKVEEDKDWPNDCEPAPHTATEDQTNETHADRVQAILSSDHSDDDLYARQWVTSDRSEETTELQGQYLCALITPLGIRPIRNRADFSDLQRAQERAQALDQPAMLAALPVGFDPSVELNDKLWMDGAGIARENDLAVFDARFIKIGGYKDMTE